MHLKAVLRAVALCWIASCGTAQAQEGADPANRIGDEGFSIAAPDGWAAEQSIGTIAVASSGAALERFESGGLEASDTVVQVVLLPADWFAQRMWFGGPEEATATEAVFLNWVLSLTRPAGEFDAVQGMGDIQPIALSSGQTAAQVPLTGGTVSGLILVSRPANGVVAFISAVSGAPKSLPGLVQGVAASLDFAGTGQSLAEALAAAAN